jgi:hypothetical protein
MQQHILELASCVIKIQTPVHIKFDQFHYLTIIDFLNQYSRCQSALVLSMVQRPYNIIDLLMHFQSKNMVLVNVGDSISLQLVRAIVYECARLYGDEITVPSMDLPYTDPHRKFYEMSIYHKNELIVTFFHIRHYECVNFESRLRKVILDLESLYNYQHFVVVLNVGLHCHDKEQYHKVLRQTFEFIETVPWNMTFFYKQTSYQHFRTPSGEYNQILVRGSRQCVPHDYSHSPMYQDVEDSEIYLANQRYILSNYTIRPINVLPFRHTAELWDLHRNMKGNFLDCTHFNEYSPILHPPVFYTLYRHFLA